LIAGKPFREDLTIQPKIGTFVGMSKVEAIEAEVRKLTRKEAEDLQHWLSEYLEDEAELNPQFVASIERGQADLRAGRVRVRKA
jgi:hypothetical protein